MTPAVEGPKEFEIKFSVDRVAIDRVFKLKLLDRPSFGRAQRVQTIYFDTAENHLFNAGITLRWRKLGSRKPVMTFKVAGSPSASLFERTEIEIPAGQNGIDIALFGTDIGKFVLKVTDGAELLPRYQTSFKRIITEIRSPQSVFEVAIDEGQFIDTDQAWPLHELELELKSGPPSDMLDFAKVLATKAGLRLELTSKSERCFILAGVQKQKRYKEEKQRIHPEMQLDAVIVAILAEGMQHFTAHIQPFRDEADARSVHQMRVGLRRLRTALKAFHKAFPQASFALFSARARELASGLGLARECDAFRELVFTHPMAHRNCPDDAKYLEASLISLRTQAYAGAMEMINGLVSTLFIIDMQNYIARRGWRSEISDIELAMLTETADRFAKNTLGDLFGKAKKRGKALIEKSDEERHEFRIALKKLRYNAQFFAPLFKNARLYRNWSDNLVPLQNSLGVSNDLAGAQDMLNRLSAREQGDFSRSAGFILGWFSAQSETADAKIEKQWKTFRKMPVFWN
jgi:inorganic triphosphatase YgiF